MQLTVKCKSKTHNLSAVIDGVRLDEVKRRKWGAGDKCVQVRHNPGLPQESTGLPISEEASSHHLATIVDGVGKAGNVSGKSAEVADVAILPEKTMKVGKWPDEEICIPWQIRGTDDLSPVVDGDGLAKQAASQIAQVCNRPVLPAQGVKRDGESQAVPRSPNDFGLHR